MKAFYNSRNIQCKSPFGATCAGDTLSLAISVQDGVYVDNIIVEVKTKDEVVELFPMTYSSSIKDKHNFVCNIILKNVGIYWYRFLINTENGQYVFGKGLDGNVTMSVDKWYQQTVYANDYRTPEHMKGGVIYHIFVDRFANANNQSTPKFGILKRWDEEVTIVDSDGVFRANDFYGGNLRGIINHLSYLSNLGVTMLYLSPIFKSSSNHRYDTGDYMEIDELLGTEDEFEELINKAMDCGIGIMLDGVFNHTGADSKYFNKFGHFDSVGAYQGLSSPYYDWYHFINYPKKYDCWWGITVTPTVNKNSLSYRNFIMAEDGVLNKWTKKGLAGWRLDVVDELNEDFVNGLHNSIKNIDSNVAIIGEVWEDASSKVAYGTIRPYLLGKQLDGVMNYPFKNCTIDYIHNGNLIPFRNQVMDIIENYPKQSLDCCMTLLGTHDTVRILNALSRVNCGGWTKQDRLHHKLTVEERTYATQSLKLASSIQYFLPGIPTIYYGDEIGMEGWEDPINRRPMDWNNIDSNLLTHYKKLGEIRKHYRFLFEGNIEIIEHNEVLILERRVDGKAICLIVNATNNNVEIDKLIKMRLHMEERDLIIEARQFVVLVINDRYSDVIKF